MMTKRYLPYDIAISVIVVAAVYGAFKIVEAEFNYRWDWAVSLKYIAYYKDGEWFSNIILQGLLRTLGISFWALILSSLFGFLLAFFSLSKIPALRWLSATYVEAIRGIPPLVLIFFGYFVLGNSIGLNYEQALPAPVFSFLVFWAGDSSVVDNYVTGVICLTLLESAFLTEIFRAGIRSIGKGQWEAGRSLGLSNFKVFTKVIFPQAWRKILPPLTGQYVSLIKDSSIISVVSIPELTFSGVEVGVSSGRIFETWLIIAGFYLMICLSITTFMKFLERRYGIDSFR